MPPRKTGSFDAAAFLESAGLGKRIVTYASKDVIFSQGDPSDTVLYLREVCSDGSGSSVRACDDDDCRASGSCQSAGNPVQSRVTATLDAGVHYLVLDTFAAAQVPCGAFTITPAGVP